VIKEAFLLYKEPFCAVSEIDFVAAFTTLELTVVSPPIELPKVLY